MQNWRADEGSTCWRHSSVDTISTLGGYRELPEFPDASVVGIGQRIMNLGQLSQVLPNSSGSLAMFAAILRASQHLLPNVAPLLQRHGMSNRRCPPSLLHGVP